MADMVGDMHKELSAGRIQDRSLGGAGSLGAWQNEPKRSAVQRSAMQSSAAVSPVLQRLTFWNAVPEGVGSLAEISSLEG